ncbi:carboxymuconolactone decarboxylase family protein [Coralliovum pocilloporae]|uniref:carboxymuconolactone decarboxylase family protein n=1 Tax=Coralliovum pocilloporae TaxID=3066369 RepID=UPI0033073FA7
MTYKTYADDLDQRLGQLYKTAAKPMQAYGGLVQAASSPGEIDSKTKELMAVAISITSRCEDCIVYHCRSALQHGATEREIAETIAVAVEMGGGPAAVYGARALAAFRDLKS